MEVMNLCTAWLVYLTEGVIEEFAILCREVTKNALKASEEEGWVKTNAIYIH